MTVASVELPVGLPNSGACQPCAERLTAALEATDGILTAAVDDRRARLLVTYDADRCSPTHLQELLRQTLTEFERTLGHTSLVLTGLDCADCATTVERGVARLPGVTAARASFMAATLQVEYRIGALGPEQIERRIRELGYGVAPPATADLGASGASTAPRPSSPGAWWRRADRFWPTLLASGLWLLASGLALGGMPPLLVNSLYTLTIAIGGFRVARAGLLTLGRARTVGIDLLMTIAVIGALAIGEWAEGAAVVVLFALGAALEEFTADRARQAIRALMQLAPREAVRLTAGGGHQRVPVEALAPGDRIAIRPGEQIAADGLVVSGQSSVNQAAITGESLPITRLPGDAVFAGTLNERGYLEVTVTRPAHDSTLARIIHLVEEAQATRAPTEQLINRFARVYTPTVIVLAALVAIVPPLFGEPGLPWLYRALTMLVIACPCALVISTPVAIVAGLARASRAGVLIKGGLHLEALGGLKALAFDKTGTLTSGRPTVTAVLPLASQTADQVLALAAAIESRSEHPLADAILTAARARGLTWGEPSDFEALTGRGARAIVDGVSIMVGNRTLWPSLEAATEERLATIEAAGQAAILVGLADRSIGIIAVADPVRTEARAAVAELRAAGVHRLVMLTGDQPATARAIADQVGIATVHAALLPDQKQALLRDVQRQSGPTAMVGDGINDAPALATASVGIAMGVAGSDTALETADVALMADDLMTLPLIVRLSQAVLATIRVNIAVAVALKILFLVATVLGSTSLWLAILADTGAALLVIANSMRLLRYPDPRPRPGEVDIQARD